MTEEEEHGSCWDMLLCPGSWYSTGMVVGKVKAELLSTEAHHSRRRHSVQPLGGKSKRCLYRGGCGSRQHQQALKEIRRAIS